MSNTKITFLPAYDFLSGLARQRRPAIGYAAAVVFACLALTLKLLLPVLIDESASLLIFLFAVMCSAWVGGFSAGLLTVALGALFNFYFVFARFDHDLLKQVANLALFAVEGAMVSFFLPGCAVRLHEPSSSKPL